MAKKNKFAKAGLAAALVTSAIVPVAAAETPAEAVTVGGVIVELDGVLVSVDIATYGDLLELGKVNPATVKYVTLSNGQAYTIDEYSNVLELQGSPEQTAEYLAEEITETELTDVKEGSVENGELTFEGDDTPEENQNETFFYNLAA